MKIASKLATITLTTGIALAGIAGPAFAANTGATTATFIISTGGTLDIAVPTSGDLGTVTAAALTVSGSLGSVTVTDNRGMVAAVWTNSVVSTSFTNGTTTVPATSVVYSSGTGTVTVGGGAFTQGTATIATSAAAGAYAGVGNNVVTWNPTITITLPVAGKTIGTYSGTITHSVA